MPRVLIGYSACPLTRVAFERQGIEAWTCDLLPARDGGRHLQCDIWDVTRDRWDAAIFHPMCTYLTVSAAWAFGDGPYHQKVKPETLVGQARRDAREEAIDNFRRQGGQNRLSPGENRWLERSATYPGIAAAMGAQWGGYLMGARHAA